MHKKPFLPSPPAPRVGKRALCLAVGLLCVGLSAFAAGGHHAVDDAAMVDAGQCQFETWIDRDSHSSRSLVHMGPACRVGPVELGLNLDSIHAADVGATTLVGPQVKWAHALTETLSAGVVLAASWQDRSPDFVVGTVLLPVTWQVSESLALHANVGRDFRRGGEPDTSRAGAALEWAPRAAWSLVLERFRESDVDHWRAGLRHALSPSVSIDISRAKGLPPWRRTCLVDVGLDLCLCPPLDGPAALNPRWRT